MLRYGVISYLGTFSTAQLVPFATAALDKAILELEAQIEAMASASLTINPGGLYAALSLAVSLVAALETAIAAGVVAPSVTLSLEVLAAFKLELEALLALRSVLLAGGIHALAYEGRVDDLGPELTQAVELPGVQPSDGAYALTLVATTPGAIEALRRVFL